MPLNAISQYILTSSFLTHLSSLGNDILAAVGSPDLPRTRHPGQNTGTASVQNTGTASVQNSGTVSGQNAGTAPLSACSRNARIQALAQEPFSDSEMGNTPSTTTTDHTPTTNASTISGRFYGAISHFNHSHNQNNTVSAHNSGNGSIVNNTTTTTTTNNNSKTSAATNNNKENSSKEKSSSTCACLDFSATWTQPRPIPGNHTRSSISTFPVMYNAPRRCLSNI